MQVVLERCQLAYDLPRIRIPAWTQLPKAGMVRGWGNVQGRPNQWYRLYVLREFPGKRSWVAQKAGEASCRAGHGQDWDSRGGEVHAENSKQRTWSCGSFGKRFCISGGKMIELLLIILKTLCTMGFGVWMGNYYHSMISSDGLA